MWFTKKGKKTELFKVDKKFIELDILKASKLTVSVISTLEKIISSTGGRKAGSNSSKEASRLLAELFSSYCDKSLTASFSASEKEYYLVYKVIPFSVPFILFFNFLSLSVVSLIFFSLVCLYLYNSYLLVKEKTYLKKDTIMNNVHGIIEAEEEVFETIIISAHHDSAPINNYLKEDKIKSALFLYFPIVHFFLLGLVSLSLSLYDIFTFKLFSIILEFNSISFLLILLSLSSYFYIYFFKTLGKEYSLGAGDNLVSSCILTELAHYFHYNKKQKKGLKNIRLIFVSFDGEECGLKGSSNWFKEHKELFINASVINLDSIYDENDILFLTKDANGFSPLSSSLASTLSAEANAMGYKTKIGAMSLFNGATDALSAAREGLEATTLIALGKNPPLHTDKDSISAINPKAVEIVISIIIKHIENKNKTKEENIFVPSLENSKKLKIIK